MMTFGFAAFLRVASLNPKQQKAELRRRVLSTGERAYDYHRSLKLASRRHVVDRAPLLDLLEAAKAVKNPHERLSLIGGLKTLALWLNEQSGVPFKPPPKTYESSRGLFRITSQPEFGLAENERRIAYYIWNTKTVRINEQIARETLSLIAPLYADGSTWPLDFGVLSLRGPLTYLLSDRPEPSDFGHRLADSIDERILEIYDEQGGPPPDSYRDLPRPPPAT